MPDTALGAQKPHEPAGSTSFTPADVAGIVAPMIGRDRELQLLLHDLYGVIERDETRTVTVIGALGVGKSRLAYELRQVLGRLPDPVSVLTLQADRQSAGQPYSLLRLLVARLFHIRENDPLATVHMRLEQGVVALLGPDALEKSHFIGHLAGYDFGASPYLRGYLNEPRRLRDLALAYATQCLVAFTAQTPLVLICDDVHYADESSLEAFSAVLSETGSMSALVVCLAQQRLYERRPDWPGRRIDLGPLDEHLSRRLVGEILRKAGKLPSDLRSMVVSRAEGNPFYIEELIKMLIADGVILPGATTWQIRQGRLARLRIPSTLADLLRTRIQSLAAVEREFLIRAAVVGRYFWADATIRLNGVTREYGGGHEPALDLDSLLARLVQEDLIDPLPESRLPEQREFVFSHELLHEVAYAQVPPDMRQVYHRQVAEWLIEHSGERADAYAGQIAEHFERSGRPHKAGIWSMRAGNHARETYALEAALDYYHTALALLPDNETALGDRIACYEGLGETQSAIARLGDAIISYTRMAELADLDGDRSAAARAWNGLAYVFDYSLDYKAAEASARRALELAEAAGDTRQLALSLFHVAWAELHNEQPRVALQLGRRALELLERIDDPAVAARCKGMIGMAYEHLSDYDAARQNLQEALGYNREVGNLQQVATLLNNLGYVANVQGDYQQALSHLQEGLRVARESRARLNEIYILTNLAYTLNGLGDYVLAEAEARRGLDLCATSRITAYADFYIALSSAQLGQERVTEAVEAAQQALDTARVFEGRTEVAAACCALGMAISAMSDSQGARPCFEESVRLYSEAGATGDLGRTLRAWALHELRTGDAERGRALYSQARELFAYLGLRHELARTPLL